MTAALNTDIDWRSKSICDPNSVDKAYNTAEDLVEDHDIPMGVARDMAADAEAAAKRVCIGCPVREMCRDSALQEERGEPGFGVWGGMDPVERLAYRPTWLKVKKIQGLATAPSTQSDQDAFHANTGVNSKYQVRLARSLAAKDTLQPQPGFVLQSLKYGRHEQSELMKLLDMVISNPTATAKDLSERIGRSATWFRDLLRLIFDSAGV